MKKDFHYRLRQCSDFDDRPIPELEDNLYSDASCTEIYSTKDYKSKQNKSHKKFEIVKNNEID